jgi:hypothetical protein
MTWTYTNPSTSNRDAVRFLLGDTNTADQRVTDEEIAFALTQAGNDIYAAAAICARALSGKYATLVDTTVETVSVKYSQMRDAFATLAVRLEAQGKRYTGALGIAVAGGISLSEMTEVRSDPDRVPTAFNMGQFDNPPYGESGRDDIAS